MERPTQDPDRHPFIERPSRTLLAMSFPVLLSLIAEPVTGLVDTAFVARLGSQSVAALGVAAVLLSSVFWIFFFLGVGTQTEVARALGAGNHHLARQATGVSIVMAAVIGVLAGLLLWPIVPSAATAMAATGSMHHPAIVYLKIRLIASPAMLLMTVGFGALRGLQDMRTPMAISISINALNILLDALLIFGAGPIPAFGIAGAAWATVVSQWLGALWVLYSVHRRLGLTVKAPWPVAGRMLAVGRDMVIRTGSLTLFLLLATRTATELGPEAGAAHQAVRQVWTFTALLLDAYAATAQSLVGYFLGANRLRLARRVAWLSTLWSVGTGVFLALGMLLATSATALLLVPREAWGLFTSAWVASALFQPLNGLSFITDGIHWGTGDYPYLRKAMLVATVVGLAGLVTVDSTSDSALTQIWLVTGVWIAARSLLGGLRIWPGIGQAPLRASR